MSFLVLCSVQEGTLTSSDIKSLERMLKDLYHESFNSSVRPLWLTIPSGSGFSDYGPSSTTISLASVPNGLDQPSRHAFMDTFCKRWAETIGGSVHDIVCTAGDQEYIKGALRLQSRRMNSFARPFAMLGMLFSAARNKIFKGYLGTTIDL